MADVRRHRECDLGAAGPDDDLSDGSGPETRHLTHDGLRGRPRRDTAIDPDPQAHCHLGRKIRFRQSTIEACILANTVSAHTLLDPPVDRLTFLKWDVGGTAAALHGRFRVLLRLFDFNATGDGAEWIDDIARTAWRTLQDLQAPSRIVHIWIGGLTTSSSKCAIGCVSMAGRFLA